MRQLLGLLAGFHATTVWVVGSSGLSVDTTVGSVFIDYNAKGEVFRNSSRMHWSTSTREGVGSSRNVLYFNSKGFHSPPQDWFFWIYSQSDDGSNPFVLVA